MHSETAVLVYIWHNINCLEKVCTLMNFVKSPHLGNCPRDNGNESIYYLGCSCVCHLSLQFLHLQADADLLSVTINIVASSRALCKWIHTACVFLYLTSFIQNILMFIMPSDTLIILTFMCWRILIIACNTIYLVNGLLFVIIFERGSYYEAQAILQSVSFCVHIPRARVADRSYHPAVLPPGWEFGTFPVWTQ